MQKILKKLISFKSVSKNREENNKALNWFKNQIKDFPLFIKEIESEGVKSLVITTKKTKKPKLFLISHLDVVPASDEMFEAEIKDSKLYGRGAYDMKFAAACYLKLLKELGDDLKDYNFGIMLTTDEEIGGLNGTKAVLEEGYNADVCILPDGGEDWNIENEAKGVWHLKIKVEGKSAHGSRPWLGENAIEKLIRVFTELKKYFSIKEDKEHYHRTLNIGKIKGGEATNQIPSYAEANIDIRFLPEEGKRKIKEILDKVENKFKNIEIESLIYGDSFSVDKDNKYVKMIKDIIEKQINEESGFQFSHGASDARFFTGTPVILFRPNGGGAHSKEERVDLKSLKKFYLILKTFVKKVSFTK